jgi:hypothetical protein
VALQQETCSLLLPSGRGPGLRLGTERPSYLKSHSSSGRPRPDYMAEGQEQGAAAAAPAAVELAAVAVAA